MAAGVGVEQGGKTVVEPAAVVGAPGFAVCIAASRVAICSGEAVGGSASGVAETGEEEVVEEALPMPLEEAPQGVGDASTAVDCGAAGVAVVPEVVGLEIVGGTALGAQPVAISRQTDTSAIVAYLKRMLFLPKWLSQLYHIKIASVDLDARAIHDFTNDVRGQTICYGLCHIGMGL